MSDSTTARFYIEVRRWNIYGSRIMERIPATIIASTEDEVTAKVRKMFGAKYDSFRNIWSHDWTYRFVDEVAP